MISNDRLSVTGAGAALPWRELVGCIADEMRRAAVAGDPPEETRKRLACLAQPLEGVRIDVTWRSIANHEAYQYTTLLSRPGEGTLSLSHAPASADPWALLGAHSFRDGDLLAVDGQVLRVADAVLILDAMWKDSDLSQQLVNACLLRAELDRLPAVVSDEELAEFVDMFRRKHRLFSGAQFQAWLDRRGITLEPRRMHA